MDSVGAADWARGDWAVAGGLQQHLLMPACESWHCTAGTTPELRDVWEQTSFRLERLQAAGATVAVEQAGLAARTAPQWRLTYTPEWTPPDKLAAQNKVVTIAMPIDSIVCTML
jgi:hypothetical protein